MDFFDILRGGTRLGRQPFKEVKVLHSSTAEENENNVTKSDGSSTLTTMKVKVSGVSDTRRMDSFADPQFLPVWLNQALISAKFDSPTAIQGAACPPILQGQDVIASAPTGSGKTLAFVLPLLTLLQKPGKDFARALIVDPTRELAQQAVRECQHIINHCSKKFNVRVVDSLAPNVKRIDIAVATPMRLVQLLNAGSIDLSRTRVVVLDEADKLLDLGFAEQVDSILTHCRLERENRNSPDEAARRRFQILFFSATLPSNVVSLARSVMVEPALVRVGAEATACPNIQQRLLFCGKEEGKMLAIRQMVHAGEIRPPVLIFVQSKERAKHLAAELLVQGMLVDAIHSGRSRAERDRCVAAFRKGSIWVLIATDVVARGMDFKAVSLVINYDLPTTAATYIHRIGRTGRAGREGQAVTLYTIADRALLRPIVNVVRNSGQPVAEWLTKLPMPRKTRVLQRAEPADEEEEDNASEQPPVSLGNRVKAPHRPAISSAWGSHQERGGKARKSIAKQ